MVAPFCPIMSQCKQPINIGEDGFFFTKTHAAKAFGIGIAIGFITVKRPRAIPVPIPMPGTLVIGIALEMHSRVD
jgi:hypothetical protein